MLLGNGNRAMNYVVGGWQGRVRMGASACLAGRAAAPGSDPNLVCVAMVMAVFWLLEAPTSEPGLQGGVQGGQQDRRGTGPSYSLAEWN
jgi:hypothetical protein